MLSQLGDFLLFAVGLVTPYSELRKVGKTAFMVASLGVVFPFIGGYLFMTVLGYALIPRPVRGRRYGRHQRGHIAQVIGDMGMGDAIESRIIIGAAVIDDVLGMLVLAVVVSVPAVPDTTSPRRRSWPSRAWCSSWP